MSAVECAIRTVERELDARDAADAEHDLLAPRLMNRPVAEEPGVCPKERSVTLEVRLEVPRPGFLFALEEEFEIDRRCHARGPERVDGGEHCDDRGFVVACRSAVETPFPVDRSGSGRRLDDLPALGVRAIAQNWFPRRCHPLRGIYRLAVVVRVEHN